MDNFYKTILILAIIIISAQSLWSQTNEIKLANEYFQQGEYDKALELYSDLEKDKNAIPLIHSNYQSLLLVRDSKALEKYLNRVLKYYPSNLAYLTDLMAFYEATDDSQFKKLIQKFKKDYDNNQYQLAALAKNLATKNIHDQALDFYRLARSVNNSPYAFSMEMAAIYRELGDRKNMTEEYLNYAQSNPANINYVKNLFQNLFIEEADQVALEETLIAKIQNAPNQAIYPDLLIWLYIQRKEFYGAFILC